jgi:uncharacterized repeat protein (TIGR01451 family)
VSQATPAGAEFNFVYAGDCATAQSSFYLGDKVCATIGDFDLPVHSRYRRFQWVAPDGQVFDQSGVKLDPQSDIIVLPTTGDFAQYGTWTIRAIDIESQIRTIAKFKVVSRESLLVDLGVIKDGPAFVLPGDIVKYTLTINNFGPDDATSVSLSDYVPSNMTFYAMKQTSGRAFFECSTPARGETGQTLCRTAGVADGDDISFDVYYLVNRDAREGESCTGAASISSRVPELNKTTNYADFEALVSTARDTEDTGQVEDN